MRPFGRGLREAWAILLDRDAERLISGHHPHNSDLMPLVDLLEKWRSSASVTVGNQFLDDHAAIAASTVAASAQTRNRPTFVLGVRRRIATATAGLAMFAGLSGIAVASNGAVPGDWNYAIDRTLEEFGIGVSSNERLEETMVLNDRGHSAAALLHASVITKDDSASQALNSAADRIATQGSGGPNTVEVREKVAELLRYLAENRGQGEGLEITERAHGIGHGPPAEKPVRGNRNGPPAGRGPGK